MVPDKTEIEERWIDAWESVLRLVGERRDVKCLLPDGAIVDVEACLGWIQRAVYAGSAISVTTVWFAGEQGVGVTAVPLPDATGP